ncbi:MULTISPECIES: sigma-70 family RNA polymerase sigma factor [unclassified Dehalobacter]|uniref:RNA polymerase sigma factor n=1 Tax=unclassified Dehalobacter TaxID=2635733 RepID=UPI000E6D2EEF|nr:MULTISPECIES: sigma-70 family RNA polymerase sigma factor [unclassified Dehalobacter]RJE46675.1 hypothetical protein A7K50_13030 [Dehalobacter sp. MCB1]TCX47442.1 hypothetical protein C1I36_14200 [Dehalobacter sp. 14DCB1]TCX55655.1 hypothetical protein C1I38_03165 [Dehalobacter sp. 12DCB1]
MSEQKEYTIIVKGKRVPVTRKVYKAYYKEYEYARNITRKAKKHELSLEKLKEDGVNPAYMCTSPSPEDMVIQKETQAKLHKALSSLPKDEQKLIYEFFYKKKSERELAAETGIPQKTINDRKHRIFGKLKELMEK